MKRKSPLAEAGPAWSLLTPEDWSQLADVYSTKLEPEQPPAGVLTVPQLRHLSHGKTWVKETGTREAKLTRFALLQARALACSAAGAEPVSVCLLVCLAAVDDGAGACMFPFTMRTSPIVAEELRALCSLGTICYRTDGTLRCNQDAKPVPPPGPLVEVDAELEEEDEKEHEHEQDEEEDDSEPERARKVDERKQAAMALVRALCRTHLDPRRDWHALSAAGLPGASLVPQDQPVVPLVYVFGL